MYFPADDCPHHQSGSCDAIEGWTDTHAGEYDAAMRELPQDRPGHFADSQIWVSRLGSGQLDLCPEGVLSFVDDVKSRGGAGIQIYAPFQSRRCIKEVYSIF